MDQETIIQKTAEFVKESFKDAEGSHDRWHTYRVRKNAIHIWEHEHVDLFVVQLAALLHDIGDLKYNVEGEWIKKVRNRLQKLAISDTVTDQVCHIVEHVSYKWAGVTSEMSSKEWMVVQDADRLDTLWAMGIARVIAYGGSIQRPIHITGKQPILHQSAEAYEKDDSTSINHFYEKILLLKDRLNTKTAKKIAEHRHQYVEDFLKEFFAEREGEL